MSGKMSRKRKRSEDKDEDKDDPSPSEEVQRLSEENAKLKEMLADYKLRLSQMASKRMREGNSCVEDLSDPHRPTLLAEQWNSLFKTGEYWTAYEKLSRVLKGDEETAEFLHKVTKLVWDACVGVVEEVVPRVEVLWPGSTKLPRPGNEEELRQQMQEELPWVRERLQSLLPEDTVQVDACVKALEEGFLSVLQTEMPKLQQKLRKHVCLLPKGDCPPAVLTRVNKAIEEDETIDERVQVDENFLKRLAKLCYAMRLQEVPLSVNFDFSPGSPLDLSLFETDSTSSPPSADWRIKSVLRPPLLRSEGGAVLSKGEVDVEPAATPAKPAAKPAQRADSQPGQ